MAPPHATAAQPDRSLLITSADPSDPRVLDLGYARNRLALCANCTLTLRGVAVARDRKGNGAPIDFIVAEPWARVVLDNTYRMRLACLDAQTGIAFAKAVGLSGHNSVKIVNSSFRGRAYPDSFSSVDAATRIERTTLEGIGWTGGYDIVSWSGWGRH